MQESVDIKKIVSQHLELDEFFSGGFAQKPRAVFQQDTEQINPAGESIMNASKTLQEIAEKVNKCRKCQIGHERQHAVPGQGNPTADIVFVGEAPGADEDAQGLPFVGRAGKLLDDIIKAMGLQRSSVFITNTIKCRPPENRDPKPDEILNCSPYLSRQLDAIRPKVIIALGAHAAKTLLDTNEPIGRLRGFFHDYYYSPDSEPVKLMPTYHPAYLLRNYSVENRKRVWQDMQKVMDMLGLESPKK